ncbi:glycosyltransferase family 4 protein [Calidifontibacter terrae]
MRERIVLWVAPVANLAGVARHILDVARVGLPGFRLVVTAPEGPLLDRLRELDCPVIPLSIDGSIAEVSRALRTTVRRLQPAIVHSHLAKADFLVTMATIGLPVALVSTEHHIPEDPLIFHGSRAKAWSRQAAHHTRIRRFAALIAVSESTKRDMLRFWRPTAPITVINNGIDRIPHPSRTPGLRLLSLSRLSPEKNIAASLRSFAPVVVDHPQATLTVAGEGDQEGELRALTEQLGIEESVSFPGFVDAAQALRDHDVLVQPSLADNFSYSLLEAVTAGLGVVASPIGGNPEILPTHCLIDPSEQMAMATAIVDQGLHLDRRPNLPANVPTVREMVARIADVYDSLTSPSLSFATEAP